MRRTMAGLALALPLMASGCYAPDLAAADFVCASSSDCPSSFVCSQGRCIPQVINGCAILSENDNGNVYTCPADFSSGSGAVLVCSAQLGAMFHLCGTVNRDASELLPQTHAACAAQSGFYASALVLSALTLTSATGGTTAAGSCAADDGPKGPYGLLGCGAEVGVLPFTPPAMPMSPCGGLDAVLPCSAQAGVASNPDWSCTQSIKDAAHRDSGQSGGGVLCCRNF